MRSRSHTVTNATITPNRSTIKEGEQERLKRMQNMQTVLDNIKNSG